ncbi:MAG: hypothetical protein IT447_12140 [Phycisphaerales bacterium]|nr:hypothetical protein [Phycisphaerales bacterium]
MPLSDQELLNAIYSGPFVTAAKAQFSNSQNANIQKWSAYVKGSANRQEFLEAALDWVSKGEKGGIGGYMSAHRKDKNINELKNHFNSVIDWVSTVFTEVMGEMKGLEWGRLYEEYHGRSYDPKKMAGDVAKLAADDAVTNRRGIYEYLLGGASDRTLLAIRVFDARVARTAYAKQTNEAQENDNSNCPLCATGHDANRKRINEFDRMDADHVAVWSKGGDSTAANCRCSASPTTVPRGTAEGDC